MPEFSVYQQQRQDGGVRIGISLNGDLCWHHFDAGTTEEDPSLQWYVDLRGKGRRIPNDPTELHRWLKTENVTKLVRQASEELADRLEAGIDVDGWPVRQRLENAPGGMQLELVTSGVRRIPALSIGEVVRRFGRNWSTMLDNLELATQSA